MFEQMDKKKIALLKFRKNSCMNMNYNCPTIIFRSIFAQMYKFLVEKYVFTIFAYELFKVKIKIVNNTRNTYIWVKILLYIIVR